MAKVIHTRMENLTPQKRGNGSTYEYTRYPALTEGNAKYSSVAFYELPPGKSNYPYHYHLTSEETFYIISGTGILKTLEGEKEVRAGDLLFFPAGEQGAHKLTNTSDSDPLVYIDFDTIADPNVCVYPDSNKVGVYGKDLRKIYRLEDNVDYYDRE
ncbi:MAG: cupin domain-containing protein [Lachnospiraceae bacterium]|nr:cupin domain-containing protein [Lachnospiraceae bacterium]